MPRWLVTLALFLVTNPADAALLRVELDSLRTTTTTAALPRVSAPWLAAVPAGVELVDDVVIVRTGERRVRHAIAHGGAGAFYLVPVGSRLLVGAADRAHDRADTLMAIDLATGELAWRRHLESWTAAKMTGELLAVERAGALDIVDVRTGRTIATTPLAGHGIDAVCQTSAGLYVKTRGDLVALSPAGAVRWVRPTTVQGSIAVTQRAVVDGWVDRVAHRYGIVSYDPVDGRLIARAELGATNGWYDHDRVLVAPDGPDQVLVSSVFGVE